MIVSDAHRRRGVAKVEDLDPTSSRAVAEYFSVLDDAAFGCASPREPKGDLAGRSGGPLNCGGQHRCRLRLFRQLSRRPEHAVIMDVEATTAIRQAEVGAAKTTLDRTAEQFDVQPSRLVADAGYGSAEMLGWLVDERGIEPHAKVFDNSERKGRDLVAQRLRLGCGSRSLYMPRRQGVNDLPSRFRRPRSGLSTSGNVRGSSAEADRIGLDSEEETVQWTILLALISQWTRPAFAFSTGKARSFMRVKRRRRGKRSPIRIL
jgi:hypothetical protein